jgi:uncharacterized protein YkwD
MLRRRTIALAAALASMALAAPASALADCSGSDLVPDAGNLGAAGQATLCLVNAERAANGLRPVSEESRLSSASTAFSQRMVAEQFFDHVAPDGSTLVARLTAVGYISDDVDWSAGENIAWGQGDLATPRSIVAAWMASPGHRANILNGEYSQVGLGLAVGSPVDAGWGATYTTDFGSVSGDSTDAVSRAATPAPSAAAQARAASAKTAAAKKAAAKKAAAKRAAAKARARRAGCARARASAKRSASSRRKARSRACRTRVSSAKKR